MINKKEEINKAINKLGGALAVASLCKVREESVNRWSRGYITPDIKNLYIIGKAINKDLVSMFRPGDYHEDFELIMDSIVSAGTLTNLSKITNLSTFKIYEWMRKGISRTSKKTKHEIRQAFYNVIMQHREAQV